MPGTATGAVARKSSTRWPAIALRVVRYEITTAITVPMVAVSVHRIIVFLKASEVAEISKNAKVMLCSVAGAGVTNCEATGENAAVSSAPEGRKTGLHNTRNTMPRAAPRQL